MTLPMPSRSGTGRKEDGQIRKEGKPTKKRVPTKRIHLNEDSSDESSSEESSEESLFKCDVSED